MSRTPPLRGSEEACAAPCECRAESGRHGECGTYHWSEATSAAYSTSTERRRPSCAAAASPRLSDKALLQSPTPTPPPHHPTRGTEPDCASPSSAAATPWSHQTWVVPTRTFVVAANERSDRLVFSFRNVLEPLHEIPLQCQNLRQVSHESQLCLLEKEARPRVSSPEHVPGEMDSGAGCICTGSGQRAVSRDATIRLLRHGKWLFVIHQSLPSGCQTSCTPGTVPGLLELMHHVYLPNTHEPNLSCEPL